jgi:hypothetical protein
MALKVWEKSDTPIPAADVAPCGDAGPKGVVNVACLLS